MAKPEPEPSRDFIRPQKIEFKFLFTKTLTETDMGTYLVLVGDAKEYINSLPKPIHHILLYSPNEARPTPTDVLKGSDGMPVLSADGWNTFTSFNKLVVGETINCWAGYNNVYKLLYLYIERATRKNEEGESSSARNNEEGQSSSARNHEQGQSSSARSYEEGQSSSARNYEEGQSSSAS